MGRIRAILHRICSLRIWQVALLLWMGLHLVIFDMFLLQNRVIQTKRASHSRSMRHQPPLILSQLVIVPISSIRVRLSHFKVINTLLILRLFNIVLDSMSLLPLIWLWSIEEQTAVYVVMTCAYLKVANVS
jgi:hypothetical protein